MLVLQYLQCVLCAAKSSLSILSCKPHSYHGVLLLVITISLVSHLYVTIVVLIYVCDHNFSLVRLIKETRSRQMNLCGRFCNFSMPYMAHVTVVHYCSTRHCPVCGLDHM